MNTSNPDYLLREQNEEFVDFPPQAEESNDRGGGSWNEQAVSYHPPGDLENSKLQDTKQVTNTLLLVREFPTSMITEPLN